MKFSYGHTVLGKIYIVDITLMSACIYGINLMDGSY